MRESRDLRETALAPSARALTDIRLVLAVVMLIGGLSAGLTWRTLVPLLVMPGNLVLLLRWGRADGCIVTTAFFTVIDALLTMLLLTTGGQDGPVLHPLPFGYVLVSALLMGLVTGTRALWAWLAPVAMGVCLLIVDAPAPLKWWETLVMLAIAGLVYLGRHMVSEAARVENLAGDVAQIRAVQAGTEQRLVLARDLHDTVAKSAAGMRMLAEVLRDSLEEERSPHAADAALLLEAADALTSESRAVLDELRTTPDGDLRRRLAHDAETWGRRLDLPVDIVIEGVPVEADDALAWHAQRALGEMLSNVENHARAESVTIRVAGVAGAGTEPLRFLVEVEDDGIGLPRRILEDPSNLRGSGHYGLCGVQERLASVGGRLSLRAREAGGTRIRATIPVCTTPPDEGSPSSAIEGGSYASTDR